jgi:hypothetical protein
MKPITLILLLAAAVPCSALHVPSHPAFIPRGGALKINGQTSPLDVPPTATTASSLPEKTTAKNSRLQKLAEKLFDENDENYDGQISFNEAYTLVLKLYVNLNRQAPIKPPTRQIVLQLFLDSDVSHDNSLNREEFAQLAGTVVRRALWKVTAHKLCKMVGAPLLTELFIRKLKGKDWLQNLAKAVVPARFHEKILPTLLSSSFWRPVLLITFVISLGNLVLSIVTWAEDKRLPDANEDPRVKAYKEERGY